jgi:hypothetical protein
VALHSNVCVQGGGKFLSECKLELENSVRKCED